MSHKTRRITTVAYAVNGSGLGHLTRVLAILRWMKRLARLSGAQLDAYVLTSSEASGLALEEGFVAFKIPSKTAIREAGLPKEDYLRLARQWVWHSLGLIKPDLLLVDTFPGGSFGELIHALDGPGSKVFIHRAMKEEFAQSESVQALLPFYDRILIPVEPNSPPQEVSARVADRTRHVGPVMLRSREEMRPRDEARRRLGIPDGKLGVWLSVGGGGDARAERDIGALISALEHEPDLHMVAGAGPLYRGQPFRGPAITWLTGFHTMEDFAGLDFAISAAGYNSFHELLHAGVPTAFFAQEKIADEQQRRVRAAEAAGCALALDAETGRLPGAHEIRRIVDALRDSRLRAELSERAREFVPLNDARGAAFEALATILPTGALEEAFEVGTPRFFLDLARYELDLNDVNEMLRHFRSATDLDTEERRELVLRFISESGAHARMAVRSFQALAGKFTAPATEDEAEGLVEAALRVIRRAAPFDDERGLLALLRMLPKDEHAQPAELSSALCEYFESLLAGGDSIWRGQTILARRLQNSGPDDSLAAMLRAAADEVRQNSGANAEAGARPFSSENYDPTYGD